LRYTKPVTTTKKPGDTSDATPAEGVSGDVALIHSVTADGEGFHVLRARENRLEIGAVRPLREGVPITGEVVTLRPRANCPLVCDVEVQLKAPEQPSDRQVSVAAGSRSRPGPAQVASDEYRRNWDAIWRSSPASKLAN